MSIRKKIWELCLAEGMTEAGAAGLMGNIEAESAFLPDNVENRCPMSDGEYTAAVNRGDKPDFVYDGYGYGLCQWTYPPRKAHLLAAAQNKGVSIADVDMQLEFLFKELNEDYYKVLATLLSSNNVRECTEAFMRQFENPADQSERAIVNRTGMAMKWYDRYAHTNEPIEVTYKMVTAQVPELCEGVSHGAVRSLQALLTACGEPCDIDGIFGKGTKAALMSYQRKHDLGADGICGVLTWSKLLNGG